MNDIPEEALKSLEETFGTRFVPHAPGGAEPPAEQPFASVFPLEDVLGASLLFWFLVLCALGSGVFIVLAIDNEDRQLTWYAAIAFVLICAAAVVELVGF
jgi:hypothetical protein